MRHISILLYPRALATSIGLAGEILQAANEQLRLRRQEEMSIHYLSLYPGRMRLMAGIDIEVQTVYSAVEETDLVILPALWRDPLAPARHEPALLQWIAGQWRRGSRLCAVGSASFLLAEAGLLRDQAGTTHWFYFDEFARRYPHIRLKRDHLATKAGQVYCVGSVNTLADLMVQLVAEAFGSALAAAVERQFSPEIRRPCAPLLFDEQRSSPHGDDEVIDAQLWLRRHYAETLSVPDLAAQAGLSVRSFNRRFKQACGLTPTDFLRQIRIEQAQALLKSSNLKIHEVAALVGYSDASHFAELFERETGVTPKLYRRQVRGKLFSIS